MGFGYSVRPAGVPRDAVLRVKHIFTSGMAHMWANRTLPDFWAREGNLYAEPHDYSARKSGVSPDAIWSYGRHFQIARILKGNGKDSNTVTLFTEREYSSMTSKHKGEVKSACNHHTVIYVPEPTDSMADILQEWLTEVNDTSASLLNSKDRKFKGPRLNRLRAIRRNFELLCTHAAKELRGTAKLQKQIRKALEVLDRPEWEAIIQREREKSARLSDAGRARTSHFGRESYRHYGSHSYTPGPVDSTEAQAHLDGWHCGVRQELHRNVSTLLSAEDRVDYLRLNRESNRVETSGYAEIPVKIALGLWQRLQAGESPVGLELTGYRVNAFANGMLSIGCHRIPVEEINGIAMALGLIPPDHLLTPQADYPGIAHVHNQYLNN